MLYVNFTHSWLFIYSHICAVICCLRGGKHTRIKSLRMSVQCKTALSSFCVLPQANNPNVSHLCRVGNQVQAFINVSIDDGECTVLWNLVINSTGAEGLRVTTCPYLEFETPDDEEKKEEILRGLIRSNELLSIVWKRLQTCTANSF